MSIKDTITGVIVTIVIGGTTFAVSQTDIVNNFAADTGMSQEEAQKYVEGVKEEDLVSFTELGEGLIESGNGFLTDANDIDCVTYEYDWESPTLSCSAGASQMQQVGNGEIALGESFKKLDQTSATDEDISTTIRLTDELTGFYNYEIMSKLYDEATITEMKNTNSYNKAILKAALDSN